MTYQLPFDVPQATYDEALGILHSALRFGICPMLESVEDMLVELGNPDLAFKSVQIAGTNGKTSTARFTAAILRGEGLRAALYTSPELVSYTERMEVAGHPVSEEAFARGIVAAQEAGRRVNARRAAAGERPYDITEFDLLTVAACVVFAEAGVDVAVLECGMGGRWDATSAVKSIKSVAITGIGLDHMRILGDTLEKIAGEKAAIIKRGRTCVLGVGTATPDSMEDVFLDQCAREGVVPTLLRPEVLADAAGEMHPGVPRAHDGLPHATYRVVEKPNRIGGSLVLDVRTTRTSYAEVSALKPSWPRTTLAGRWTPRGSLTPWSPVPPRDASTWCAPSPWCSWMPATTRRACRPSSLPFARLRQAWGSGQRFSARFSLTRTSRVSCACWPRSSRASFARRPPRHAPFPPASLRRSSRLWEMHQSLRLARFPRRWMRSRERRLSPAGPSLRPER